MRRWEAALLATSDVRTPWLAEFRAWHNMEHLPERMAVPGFVAARRFVSAERDDRFLTLYQLASIEVLESAPYRALLDAPDPTTMRILQSAITNTVRLLCRRTEGFARGEGGLVAFWPDPSPATLARIAALESEDDVAAAHLLVPDARMTGAPSVAVPDAGPASAKAVMLAESWTSRFGDGAAGTDTPELYRLEAALAT